MYKVRHREDTKDIIATLFMADRFAFNVTCSPYYKEMVRKTVVLGLRNKTPSYNKTRTTLLNRRGIKDARV
jgi:hypothetical protein